MKTFTPNDSDAMADATDRVFGRQAMFVEGLLFHCAAKNSSEYLGFSACRLPACDFSYEGV